MFVGCKPYDVPEFQTIETSETGFLIPLEGEVGKQKKMNSKEEAEKSRVATKRVQIPHKWVQTGRAPFSGEWVSTVRLVKVDRSPESREWTADASTGTNARDETIHVESADSVDIGVGFSCTARIEEDDASNFLYNYSGRSLADIIDNQVRLKIQEVTADECAKYNLDELRTKKNSIMEEVRKVVIPFFQETGITITSLGMSSGLKLDPKIQAAIDKTVEDQQLKVSALAEKEAQTIKNETIKLEAEGKAEAVKIQAGAEAEAIKLVADAKAYEIEKASQNQEAYLSLKNLEVEMERLNRWDGKYPIYFMGMGNGKDAPSLLIQPPTATVTKN